MEIIAIALYNFIKMQVWSDLELLVFRVSLKHFSIVLVCFVAGFVINMESLKGLRFVRCRSATVYL